MSLNYSPGTAFHRSNPLEVDEPELEFSLLAEKQTNDGLQLQRKASKHAAERERSKKPAAVFTAVHSPAQRIWLQRNHTLSRFRPLFFEGHKAAFLQNDHFNRVHQESMRPNVRPIFGLQEVPFTKDLTHLIGATHSAMPRDHSFYMMKKGSGRVNFFQGPGMTSDVSSS